MPIEVYDQPPDFTAASPPANLIPGGAMNQTPTLGPGELKSAGVSVFDAPPSALNWSAGDYANDIEKSAEAGNMRGVHQVIGAPGDIAGAIDSGKNWLITKVLEKLGVLSPEQGQILRHPLPGTDYEQSRRMGLPTSGELDQAIEKATGGQIYQPQSVPGEYARTLAQFAPSAALGYGTPLQRMFQVAVPAVTSETAGQVARHTVPEFESAARVGGALLGAGGVSLGQRTGTPEAAIGRSMIGADQSAVQRASALMQDAASQGVRLTWDEAIQQVTNGATRLSDLRRGVEGSSGGGAVLKPLMAERPAQIQSAGDAAIGAIAPNRMDPISAGIGAQKAAQGTITDTQAAINAATNPYYKAAESQLVAPSEHIPLLQDPLYTRTLDAIRNNPELNRGIDQLPNNSVGVVDLVQRRLREMADNAKMPGQANTSNLAASNLLDARTGAIKAADAATGGPTGSYATARLGQSMLRDQFLAPLTEGPIGDVAKTTDVLRQGNEILPNRPATGSAAIVADTIKQLAGKNQAATENVIHSHIRAAFDEATQHQNQWGGSKFADVIAGNGQQAQNLEAAVRALPNGDARWDGLRRFLDVAEATGKRLQPGSPTQPLQAMQKELQGASLTREAAAAATTGGFHVIKRLGDFWDQLNLGRNNAQIARILSDPASGRLLEQLAAEPAGSSRAAALAMRLSYMGRSAARGGQSTAQPGN